MNDINSELEKNAAKHQPAEDLEIIDASVGSMSLGSGGNMHPAEIQVKTNNLIEIIDASPGSLRIGLGGNMHPAEIQVKTNNLVEVSTGRVERKCTPEKIFKYLIFVGCLLFFLILAISLGLKHSGETETLKQCLAGYYNFPWCISK